MNRIRQRLHEALEARLNGPYIRTICCLVLGAFLIMQSIAIETSDGGPTVFGPYPGADFAVFYVAGSIFDSYPPDRIYDMALHTRLYHGLFPLQPPQGQLPYANAPFFVLPFALLAQLSYPWAYGLWIAISCGLYYFGLRLLRGAFTALSGEQWSTVLLLAFSFSPFLFEGVAGGQVSVFGFFWLSLTLSLEKRGHSLAAGVALAFLTYKPTLLVLILPMLVITRRKRMLGGFAIGVLGLAVVSILAVGREGCLKYLETLMLFLHATADAASGLRTWKYVDVNSFSRLLAGGHIGLRITIILAAAAALLPRLFAVWSRSGHNRENYRDLAWSSTIACTLVLNVYLGIYDTILIVPGVLIATDLLSRTVRGNAFPCFRYLLVLLYLTPWVTQIVARLTGVQLYTLVLAGFVIYLTKPEKDRGRGIQEINGHAMPIDAGRRSVADTDLEPRRLTRLRSAMICHFQECTR